MNRFIKPSTDSQNDPQRIHHGIFWLLFALAITTYTLPWLENQAVSLSLGAYDLAEWASLHPEVRANPVLLTSLLLRIQPMLLACSVILTIPRDYRGRAWWAGGLLLVLTVMALLPPLEFFSFAGGDGNYQQQFGLAIITLLVGSIGLSGLMHQYRRYINVVFLGGGIVTCAAGVLQTLSMMRNFGLSVQVEPGWFAFELIVVVWLWICVRRLAK